MSNGIYELYSHGGDMGDRSPKDFIFDMYMSYGWGSFCKFCDTENVTNRDGDYL